MLFAVQKRASSSVILMLLGYNCGFFSQELRLMLLVSLLIFSRSPIHYGWFYCHLFGQKRTPSFLEWLMILPSSLRLIPKKTGCCIRTSCYFTTTLRVVPSDKFRRYSPWGRPLSCFVGIRCPRMLYIETIVTAWFPLKAASIPAVLKCGSGK